MNTIYKINNFFYATAVVAVSALTLSSCHKTSSVSGAVTEADAAQVTVDAVSPTTGGFVSQVSASVTLFEGGTVTGGTVNSANNHLTTDSYNILCGATKDSTVAYASTGTGVPSFTYSLAWSYKLDCSVPSTFTLNFNGQGTYDGFIQSSSFKSSGGFVLSGLAASTADYTFNSTYTRTGTTTSKVGNKNTFDHTLSIASSNIVYDKTAKEIVSGTAIVSIKVTSSSGNSWTYGGTLTFMGSKTAKLVLNSGATYTINWN